MRRSSRNTAKAGWESASRRIEWLVNHRFAGNRSRFAEAAGCSHTLVFKIIRGQPPGRRFLEAVSERLKVPLAWLVDGEGGPAPLPGKQVLMSRWPLSVPVENTFDGLEVPLFDLPVPSASMYWMHLTSSEPIVR